MKKRFTLALMLLAFGLPAQTVLENNRPGLKWYQVNTPHFRVLYPKGFDAQAQRMANTFEHIHDAEAKSLGSRPRRITVVLQNESAVSNAFVSILPRRSEFYTMPPQDYNFLGTNDWLDLVAAHEYRHVVQYQHATRGFNRLFYYLFGNNTLAGMSEVAAPRWFWEGDAVATETAFTHSGRGRIPNFGLLFRTNLMEGRTFNYHKQYLLSYKHQMPNHYVLGFHMVSYLRRKTNDPQIWGKITGHAWDVPFIPFTFSNAIKRETGMYVTQLYRTMAEDLKKEWKAEIDQLKPTPYTTLNKRERSAYTDYLYPQPQPDGSVVVMKKGIGDIEQYVKLYQGKEEKIFTPGPVNATGMLSVAGNRVVWNEYGFHPRWRVRNFSLIKTYDMTSGKKEVIGAGNERYAGSSFSPDGTKLVSVRSGKDYRHALVIMTYPEGEVLKEFANPDNFFYAMPRWSPDGRAIVALETTPSGKGVVKIDVASGASEKIMETGQENTGYPVLSGNYLLFNSPESGIDNIYATDLTTRKRYAVTVSKYGAYNPAVSPDGKTIYYNEQTRDGLDVVSTPFDPSQWSLYDGKKDSGHLFQHLADQEGRPGLLDSVPATALPVKRYSKLKGIINPYSWGLYTDNSVSQLDVGITSRDVLSTTSINAGYTYDVNERTGYTRATLSYQGWFPILDFTVRNGKRSTDETDFGLKQNFKWTETSAEAGVRIPLLLTRSKYLRQLTLGNVVGITKTRAFTNTVSSNGVEVYHGPARATPAYDTLSYIYKDQLNDGDLVYNRFTLSFYNVLKPSYRDFLYRWGQALEFETSTTPFGGDFKGYLAAIRGVLYFPGVTKHHFLYVRGGYQKSTQSADLNQYTFRNRIAKPRGYSYPTNDQFASVSVNYAFPVWYPDISVGPIFNLQRIKLNLFFDYGQGTGGEFLYYNNAPFGRFINDATYQSVGVETTFDFNLFRFLPKFEAGFRSTYLSANRYSNSGMVFEFLLGNIGF